MGSLFDTPEFNQRLFFPRRDVSATPPGATDLRIVTGGADLHLRWHRSHVDGVTVLLFHGNGETVSDYDDVARRFAACGANLAVVDYRGYGSSTGTPTLRDALLDAHAVAPALVSSGGGARIIVMGRSLGSASAAELCAAPTEAMVGFIWESGFVDLDALIRRRGLTPPPRLPDEDLVVFDPIPKLRRGDRPLLVLHGAEDSMIAPSEARAAFEAARSAKKELVYIPGRGHNDLSAEPQYWDAMARFASECRA